MKAAVAVAAGATLAAAVVAAVTSHSSDRKIDPAFCAGAVEVAGIEDDVQRITRRSTLVKTEAWKTGQGIEVIERDYAECVTEGKTR